MEFLSIYWIKTVYNRIERDVNKRFKIESNKLKY